MSFTHRFLKTTRQVHLYLGVFFAPALLFFAFTGGLQTFSLHETTRGSSYTPPAWLVSMAQLHKKQTTVKRVRHPASAAHARTDAGHDASAATTGSRVAGPANTRVHSAADHTATKTAPSKKNLWPMKIFFGLVALSLFTSTLTGLYLAYRYSRKPKLVSGILLAGIVVPVLLWLF